MNDSLKVLAALKKIDSDLKLRIANLAEEIESLKVAPAPVQDFRAILEEVNPITSLPLDLVYSVDLKDSVEGIKAKLEESETRTKSHLESLIGEAVSAASSSAENLADCISTESRARIASVTDLSEQLSSEINRMSSAIESGLSDLKATLDIDLDHLGCTQKNDLSEAIVAIESSIQSTSSDLRQLVESLSKETKADSETTWEKTLLEIESSVESARLSLDAQIREANDRISSAKKTLREEDEASYRDLESQISRKADRDHAHPEYAKVKHSHSEYAKKSDLDDTAEVVGNLSTGISSLESKIDQALREVKTKLDLDQALTRSDIDNLRDKIREDLQQSIPAPKDGKDAFEWEFKWHPDIKGRLMFKRQDQKSWKFQDLIIKINQGGNSFIGVGASGIEDAPADGKSYLRKNKDWVEYVAPTPAGDDAPIDGHPYMRQDATWVQYVQPDMFPDVPDDGKTYIRKHDEWVEYVPPVIPDPTVEWLAVLNEDAFWAGSVNILNISNGSWLKAGMVVNIRQTDGYSYGYFRYNSGSGNNHTFVKLDYGSDGSWSTMQAGSEIFINGLTFPPVQEAPDDGKSYLRTGKAWTEYVEPDYFVDVPDDGKTYVRKYGEWVDFEEPDSSEWISEVSEDVFVPGSIVTVKISNYAWLRPGMVVTVMSDDGSFRYGYFRYHSGSGDNHTFVKLDYGSDGSWSTIYAGAKIYIDGLPWYPIPEAPKDGKKYVRKDGAWVEDVVVGQPTYIQDTQPTDTGKYLWVETNIDGDPTKFTIHVNL